MSSAFFIQEGSLFKTASACRGQPFQRYSCGVFNFGLTTKTVTGALSTLPVHTPLVLASSPGAISKTAWIRIFFPLLGSGAFCQALSPQKNSEKLTVLISLAFGGSVRVLGR